MIAVTAAAGMTGRPVVAARRAGDDAEQGTDRKLGAQVEPGLEFFHPHDGEATRHALVETRRPYVEVHFANTVRQFDQIAGPGQLKESRFTYASVGLVMGLRDYSYVGGLLGLCLALDDQAFLAGDSARQLRR